MVPGSKRFFRGFSEVFGGHFSYMVAVKGVKGAVHSNEAYAKTHRTFSL